MLGAPHPYELCRRSCVGKEDGACFVLVCVLMCCVCVFVRLRPIRWRSHVCVLVLLFVSREGVRDGIYAERAALTAARHSLKGGTERDRMRDESGGRGDFCLASGARMRVQD